MEQLEILHGETVTADFEENTITLEVSEEFKVHANQRFILIDYSNLSMTQYHEIINLLENINK